MSNRYCKLEWEDLLQVLGITKTRLDLESICFVVVKRVFLSLIGPFVGVTQNFWKRGQKSELFLGKVIWDNYGSEDNYSHNKDIHNYIWDKKDIVGKLRNYSSGTYKWSETDKRVIFKEDWVLIPFERLGERFKVIRTLHMSDYLMNPIRVNENSTEAFRRVNNVQNSQTHLNGNFQKRQQSWCTFFKVWEEIQNVIFFLSLLIYI